PIRVQVVHQRHHARDVRRGHRRAADGSVVGGNAILPHGRRHEGRHRAEDVDAGGADVHSRGAVVGEAGQGVVMVGGGDRNDIVQVVAGRVGRSKIIVGTVVARGGDENVAVVAGKGDGVVQSLVESAAAPAVVGDGCAHLDRVLDGADR